MGIKMEILINNGWNFGLTISGIIAGFAAGYYYAIIKEKNAEVNSDEFIFESPQSKSTYRLILGVRTDLKMQKGKVAAQCAHASVAAYVKAVKKAPDALKKWICYGQAKITVKIDSEEEMNELKRLAKSKGILTSVIQDAGHTQVDPGSKTVIAFGPAPKEIIDEITGHLKLY